MGKRTRRRSGSPYSGRASSGGRTARDRAVVVYRADEPCLTYQCPACGSSFVTAVVDPGTPPDVVGCVATPGCRGQATTDLDHRKVPDEAASWEWYRPNTDMIATVRARGGPLWEHVKAGGMMLRHRRSIRDLTAELGAAAAKLEQARE